MTRLQRRARFAITPVLMFAAACGSTVADNALPGPAGSQGATSGSATAGGATLGAATTGSSGLTSGGDPTTTGGGATTGGSTTGVSGTTGSTGAATGTSGTTTVTRADARPLKVGVIVPHGNAGAMFGVDPVDTPPEQAESEVRALIAGINSRGGFGGHKVNVVFRRQDRTDEGAATMTRIQNEVCTAMTEDEKVDFVITLANAYTTYANECYLRHQTPILTTTAGAEDVWQRRRPWFMPLLGLNISRMGRLMPVAFAEQGFLTQKMGVLAFDRAPERSVVEKYLLPGIAKRGGKVLETVYMTAAYEDVAAQTASAALRFKQAGIDRVIVFAPGGGVWLIFTQQAKSQNYYPKYGFSSMDSPNFTAGLMPHDQLVGSKGVGASPAIDVAPRYRPPRKKVADACWKYLNEKTGSSYQTDDVPGILAWARCEFLWVAEAGFRGMTARTFRKQDVQSSFFAIGGSYDSILLPKVTFKPGVVDAVDAYAHVVWDVPCECYRYASKFLPLRV